MTRTKQTALYHVTVGNPVAVQRLIRAHSAAAAKAFAVEELVSVNRLTGEEAFDLRGREPELVVENAFLSMSQSGVKPGGV